MNDQLIYIAEPSATMPGFVGVAMTRGTHKLVVRTAIAYPAASWAIHAARMPAAKLPAVIERPQLRDGAWA